MAEGESVTGRRPLYAPPAPAPGTRRGAGLLAVAAGLVVACLRLAKRSGEVDGRPAPASARISDRDTTLVVTGSAGRPEAAPSDDPP